MADVPRLLIDEPPLQVLPSLATAIGLNEALFLQQLHYQLRLRQHLIDDVPWVFNTLEQWHELFPFWTVRTIQRIITTLVQLELLISANHNTNRQVQTRWYTINYGKLETRSVSISPGQIGQLGRSKCPTVLNPKTPFKERNSPPISPPRGEEHADSSVVSSRPAPRKRCPQSYEPDATLRAWAKATYPAVNVDEALEAMKDYEFARGHTDWDATLRTWIRNEAKRQRTRSRGPTLSNADLVHHVIGS